ncbi:hypothetical protein [Ramlibacter sp.]|uniref:hypothetical protein n=1 Tax=Ramlibacter sp. TaxID=1917967 RepID=UPI0035AE61E9
MPLPEDPEARKEIARDMVALWRLPPDHRKEILAEAREKQRRATAFANSPAPDDGSAASEPPAARATNTPNIDRAERDSSLWKDVARRQSNRVLWVSVIACLNGSMFLASWADDTARSMFSSYPEWREPFWFWIGQWILIIGSFLLGNVLRTLLFLGIPKPPGSD